MLQDNPSVGRRFFRILLKTLLAIWIEISQRASTARIVFSLPRNARSGVFSGFAVLLSVISFAPLYIGVAQAQTPNTTMNYQGRILNYDGSLVADGDYHIEFKIYSTQVSGATAQGVCTGSCLWMETRSTGNLIRVANGYVSANLGSVTAFPSNMPWGSDLYVTMRVGGSAGSPSWDTEMVNFTTGARMKITAVPLAFVANNVATGDTNTASTNSNNISIQSGNALGTTSNSGNVTVDTGSATGTTGTITLGATNASALTLGRSGLTTTNAGALTVTQLLTANGNLTIAGGTTNGVYYRDGSGNVVTTSAGTSGQCFRATTGSAPSWGSCSGTGDILQDGNNFGVATVIGTNDAYDLQLEAGGVTYVTLDDATGLLTVAADLTAAGLTTLNGGLTVQAGDTFTFNSDAFTDLTGSGLAISSGALVVDDNTATGFFRNGGNTFSGASTIGNNNNADLGIETNGTTRLTVEADGDVAFDTNTLFVDAVNNRVGIGDSTPSYALDVQGVIQVASGSSSPTLRFLDDSDSDYFAFGFNRANNDLRFASNIASDILTIEQGGLIGINDPTADGVLTVRASATTGNNPILIVDNLSSTGSILELQDNGSPVFTVANGGNTNATGQLLLSGTGGDQSQLIVRANSGQTVANPLVLLQNSSSAELARINATTTSLYFGNAAGGNSAAGANNTGIGASALGSVLTGTGNTTLGSGALASVSVNDNNTAVGYNAGNLATGGNNIFLGALAGDNVTTGTDNIIIGYNLDASAAGVSNELRIGGVLQGSTSTLAAQFNGALTVTGLTTLNGGLTIDAGDTLTFNGDAFTDLTGTGLVVSSNALTLDITSSAGAFINGGNSFAGAATLGTNDANSLSFETGGNTQATIAAGGATTFQNSTNSASAFRVLSSAGPQVFGVDTSNRWINIGQANSVLGRMIFYGDTGGNDITLVGQTAPAGNRTITLPDATGTICLQSSTSCGFALTSLTDNTTDAFDLEEGTNNYFNINTTDASENISFGNTTINPSYDFLGSGSFNVSGVATFYNDLWVDNNASTYLTGDLVVAGGTDNFYVSTLGDFVSVGDTTDLGARLQVKGAYDETQLLIRANSTQSNSNALIRVETSAGAELFSVRAQNDSSLFIGAGSGGSITAGTANIGIGLNALTNVSTSSENTAIGAYSQQAGNAGQNTSLGAYSLSSATLSGGENTAIGGASLQQNTTGAQNVGLGRLSLYGNFGGSQNTAVGAAALFTNVSGDQNTAVGNGAGQLSTGGQNVFLGFNAGDNLTAGGSNIIIGSGVDAVNATGSSQLNIGDTLYGDLANDRIAVGTSTTTAARLTVNNAASSDNIFVAQDNGAPVFTIADGGASTFTSTLAVNTLGSADTSTFVCRNTSNQLATCSSSPLTNSLTDNITDAFDLQEGTNNYFNINTTNSSENISFGNAVTNPSYTFLGSGTLTVSSGSISSPGGSNSEQFGLNATAGGSNSVALGNGANASGNDSIAIGEGSDATSTNSVAIGRSAQATGQQSIALLNGVASAQDTIAIGYNSDATTQYSVALGSGSQATGGNFGSIALGFSSIASADDTVALGVSSLADGTRSIAIGTSATNATFANSIALGSFATNTAANQIMIGGSGNAITNLYLGLGETNFDADNADASINATSGDGTDVSGADLVFNAGSSTGSGTGGSLLFQTSSAGSTGTALNPLTTRLTIDSDGLATFANDVFVTGNVTATDVIASEGQFGATAASGNLLSVGDSFTPGAGASNTGLYVNVDSAASVSDLTIQLTGSEVRASSSGTNDIGTVTASHTVVTGGTSGASNAVIGSWTEANAAAGAIGILYGSISSTNIAADVNSSIGVTGQTYISGSSNAISVMGAQFQNVFDTSGTVGNSYGVYVAPTTKPGGGTLTNNVGIAVYEQNNGTNNTNLLIGTATIPAGQFSIYNSSTDDNIFAGNLRIGSTTAPTVALDVTGSALVSGTLGVTGNTTLTADLSVNGNTTIGNAASDNLTVTASIQGANALVFEGATDGNGFATTLQVTDPTANNTIILPNASGTLLLAPAGSGNGLVQVPTSNTAGVAGANVISPTAASIVGLTVNGTTSTAATALAVVQTGAAAALTVSNSSATATTVASITSANTATTQTNTLLLERNGASGTTTNALNITQTAGTLTNGIIFNGTIGTDITSAAARTLNITTGTTGALTLDTGTTGAINIGTNANAKTVTLGSTTGAAITNIQAGTGTAAGDLNILTTAGGIINISNNAVTNKVLNLGSAGSTNAASTVNIANTNANVTQAVNIGATNSANNVVLIQGGTSATAIRLAAGSAGTITVGSQTVANTVSVGTVGSAAFSSTVNIATSTGALQAVTIGSNANFASTLALQGGSGATAITLTPQTTGQIVVGAAAGTGNITLGSSSATQSVLIGNGAGASTVSIANATVAGATVNIAGGANTSASTVSIANGATAAATTVSILSGVGTASTASLLLANNTRVTTIDIGNIAAAAARTINLGTGSNTAGADTINIGTGTPSGSGTKVITIGSSANVASTTSILGGNGTAAIALTPQTTGTIVIGAAAGTGNITLGSSSAAQSVFIGNGAGASTVTVGGTTAGSGLTLNSGTTAITANSTGLTFSTGGARAIGLAQAPGSTAGYNLTVSAGGAGSGGSDVAGGALNLQGGAAGGTNANGGQVVISGGAGIGTGVLGLVSLAPTTFLSSGSAQSSAVSFSVANIDTYSTIAITASATGVVATVPVPNASNQVTGRILYVTAANGSNDFTLSLANTSGSAPTYTLITMKANNTATLIWNGYAWTAAGASSATDLQAAYANTATSAGAAELILNAPGGAADGLTIRNNATTPIVGGLFEVQTSIGSNLFTVNNNATEYAKNGGAETADTTVSTFPATTWDTTTGGTVDRYQSATGGFSSDNLATGQASVRVQTTTTNHGARNRLSTTLTSGLTYTVSFAVRGATNFSTLEALYSPDGTTTGTTSCAAAQTVTSGQWKRISCTFTAAGTITSSNSILIRQTDATARTFYIDNLSVNVNASANFAGDGSADNAGTFATNWGDYEAGAVVTVSQETTVIYEGSASAKAIITPATANVGIRNNMSITPAISTQFLVSFYARSTTTMTSSMAVGFLPAGGNGAPSGSAACVDYNTQSLVADTWTKITCLFTTPASGISNPDLVIYQTDSAARTIYIDALSITLNTNNSNNVQIGGGNKGGPATLFTLDRSASAPIADNNDAYLGSMYYNTTTGRIQCYEADGWGACGAAPDNIVNLNPEYAGAVLNGTGVGTMTADFCAEQAGVLNVNTTLCASGEAKNFYRWTSPQATQQTYSIYVTYQLPATFNGFSSDDTVQLVALTDSANATVSYEMYKSTGSAVTACGTETIVSTGVQTVWQTAGINGNESTGCSFNSASASNFVIFKINMKANSNANAYVSTLSFTTTGR